MNIVPDHLTKKFIATVDLLKKKGIIKNDTALANTIEFSQGNLSKVLNGKRNIPFKYAFAFARQYQLHDFLPKESHAPINLPVVGHEQQKEYLEKREDQTFINSLSYYPMVLDTDTRHATWRWFQVGGSITDEDYHAGDYLLGRLIHPDDWTILEPAKWYIIVLDKTIFFRKLVKNGKGKLLFTDGTSKEHVVNREDLREVWKYKESVLKRIKN